MPGRDESNPGISQPISPGRGRCPDGTWPSGPHRPPDSGRRLLSEVCPSQRIHFAPPQTPPSPRSPASPGPNPACISVNQAPILPPGQTKPGGHLYSGIPQRRHEKEPDENGQIVAPPAARRICRQLGRAGWKRDKAGQLPRAGRSVPALRPAPAARLSHGVA